MPGGVRQLFPLSSWKGKLKPTRILWIHRGKVPRKHNVLPKHLSVTRASISQSHPAKQKTTHSWFWRPRAGEDLPGHQAHFSAAVEINSPSNFSYCPFQSYFTTFGFNLVYLQMSYACFFLRLYFYFKKCLPSPGIHSQPRFLSVFILLGTYLSFQSLLRKEPGP